MEIRQIRYFVAIAERAHFSQAAAHLHVAQSALSRQMKLLEEEIGTPLFDRLPRGVRLTPAGRFFLDEARGILAQLGRVSAQTRAAATGRAGRLRLGVIEMAAWQGLVPDSIRRFRRAFPAVELDLTITPSPGQVEALRAGRLDAGLLYYPPQDGGFTAIPLVEHPVMIALPAENPLAAAGALRLADLTGLPFIGFRRAFSPQFHDQIHAECRARGFVPDFITETSSESEMLALVSAGAGVCFVNSCQRWREPHAVRIRPILDFDVRLVLHFAYPAGQDLPPVRHFQTVVTGDALPEDAQGNA